MAGDWHAGDSRPAQGVPPLGCGLLRSEHFLRRKLLALLLLSAVMVSVPAVILLDGQYLQSQVLSPTGLYVFHLMLVPSVRCSLPEMSPAQKGALVSPWASPTRLPCCRSPSATSGTHHGRDQPACICRPSGARLVVGLLDEPVANWILGSVAFPVGCYLLLRNPGPLYTSPSRQAGSDDREGPSEPGAKAAVAAPHYLPDPPVGPTTSPKAQP